MVTNVDEEIPQAALDEIIAVGGVDEAFVVSLPGIATLKDPVALANITNPVLAATQ
jgi:hypothetical protein